jgi:lipopolysaccharide biosynthesis regulator YciM
MIRSRHDLAASLPADRASSRNRKCVRASLLLQGDIAVSAGAVLIAAIDSWQRIEQQGPTYLALVAQRLLDAFRKLDRREEGLAACYAVTSSATPRSTCLTLSFNWCLKAMGPRRRTSLVRDELKRNPTLLGFDKLLEARLLVVCRSGDSS